MMLTTENIKNHFIVNPEWKQLFYKHYKGFTEKNYIKRAVEILKKNGYTIKTIHPYKKSERLKTVIELELYKNDEWMFSIQTNEYFGVQSIVIDIICNYEIDFSKLK